MVVHWSRLWCSKRKKRESIPSLGPQSFNSPLNNHKVSWLMSERKGSGNIEKSRWYSGVAVVLEA